MFVDAACSLGRTASFGIDGCAVTMEQRTVVWPDNMVWLASYPRSGNTYLRSILWTCFGLQTGSIYPDDLSLDVVQHVEGQIVRIDTPRLEAKAGPKDRAQIGVAAPRIRGEPDH